MSILLVCATDSNYKMNNKLLNELIKGTLIIDAKKFSYPGQIQEKEWPKREDTNVGQEEGKSNPLAFFHHPLALPCWIYFL